MSVSHNAESKAHSVGGSQVFRQAPCSMRYARNAEMRYKSTQRCTSG